MNEYSKEDNEATRGCMILTSRVKTCKNRGCSSLDNTAHVGHVVIVVTDVHDDSHGQMNCSTLNPGDLI